MRKVTNRFLTGRYWPRSWMQRHMAKDAFRALGVHPWFRRRAELS